MSRFKFTEEKNPHGKSGVVSYLWYNENLRELAIALNDRVYIYLDIPLGIYKGFIDSGSLGNFYSDNIRGKYSSFPAGNLMDFGTEKVGVESDEVPELKEDTQQSTVLEGLGDRKYKFTIVVDHEEKLITIPATSESNAFDVLNELAVIFNKNVKVKKLEMEIVYG